MYLKYLFLIGCISYSIFSFSQENSQTENNYSLDYKQTSNDIFIKERNSKKQDEKQIDNKELVTQNTRDDRNYLVKRDVNGNHIDKVDIEYKDESTE